VKTMTRRGENASSSTSVRVEKSGAVTTVILSRIEARNAVDRPTADRLSDAFLAFEKDENASVAVLWGEGGTFCAGADLKAIASGDKRNRVEPPRGNSRLARNAPMGPTRMLLSKPVIAAIAGHAVAGGLELALWCDLRVAEANAVLGVFSRRWGVPLIDGGTIRLPRLIGQSRAMDMILTGRAVSADEALAMGLVNRLVPEGESRRAAEALAQELTRFPAVCLKGDRLSVLEQWGLSDRMALANEFRRGMRALAVNETFAGAARFAKGKGRGGSFKDI
jgi:enoyl-CoA hydratase